MARGLLRSERLPFTDHATVWRPSAASVERIEPDSAAVPRLHGTESAGAAAVSAVHGHYGPVPERRQLQLQRASGASDPPLQGRAGDPRRLHLPKTIGLADNALDAENIADQFNRRLDRSIINYDYPHLAKLTWIYELADRPGQGRSTSAESRDKIIGGWQLTANHQFRSGAPLPSAPAVSRTRPERSPGPTTSRDRTSSQRGRGHQLPRLRGRNGLSEPRRVRESAGFRRRPERRAAARHAGAVPAEYSRPVLHLGKHRHSEGFQVQRNQRYVELRGTFLNPFNRHGVGGLITNITDPNFGQFTGQQTGPRNIEIALRLNF